MKKTLIVLTTAFNPSKLHNTAFGELRIMQYCLGLARVAEILNRNADYDALIVDNTITPDWQISPKLNDAIAAMPRTKKLFFVDNDLGSKNKGAGVVIDWRAAAKETDSFKSYDYVMHFEPRLILLDFSFFDRFEKVQANYILIETIRHRSENKLKNVALKVIRRSNRQCWTGIFTLDRANFLDLISRIDIDSMTEKKVSLEQAFYDQFIDKFIGVDHLGMLWHDGFTNTYKVY